MEKIPLISFYFAEMTENDVREFEDIIDLIRLCTPYELNKTIIVTPDYQPDQFWGDFTDFDEDYGLEFHHRKSIAILPNAKYLKDRPDIVSIILSHYIPIVFSNDIDIMLGFYFPKYSVLRDLHNSLPIDGKIRQPKFHPIGYNGIRRDATYWSDGKEHFGYTMTSPLDPNASPKDFVWYSRKADESTFLCYVQDDPRLEDPRFEQNDIDYSKVDVLEHVEWIDQLINGILNSVINPDLTETIFSQLQIVINETRIKLQSSLSGHRQSSRKKSGENIEIWEAVCDILRSSDRRISKSDLAVILAERGISNRKRFQEDIIIRNNHHVENGVKLYPLKVIDKKESHLGMKPGRYTFVDGYESGPIREYQKIAIVYRDEPFTTGHLRMMIIRMGKAEEYENLWYDLHERTKN